jgi:hypothetical protein
MNRESKLAIAFEKDQKVQGRAPRKYFLLNAFRVPEYSDTEGEDIIIEPKGRNFGNIYRFGFIEDFKN